MHSGDSRFLSPLMLLQDIAFAFFFFCETQVRYVQTNSDMTDEIWKIAKLSHEQMCIQFISSFHWIC